MIVTSAPDRWDWAKWLPHCQHPEARDGCGERRLVFSSPADLEAFAGDDLLDRKEWTPPASGLHGGPDPSAPPLWVIVDDNCGAAEDWAGATGKRGVGRVCFVAAGPRGRRRRRLRSRHHLPAVRRGAAQAGGGGLPVTSLPEELDDAFYAVADTMSIAEAERFARTLAPWRPGRRGHLRHLRRSGPRPVGSTGYSRCPETGRGPALVGAPHPEPAVDALPDRPRPDRRGCRTGSQGDLPVRDGHALRVDRLLGFRQIRDDHHRGHLAGADPFARDGQRRVP